MEGNIASMTKVLDIGVTDIHNTDAGLSPI